MIERYNQFYKWWIHPKIQANVLYDQICWAAFNCHFQLIFSYIFLTAIFSFYGYSYGLYACYLGFFTSTAIIIGLRFFSHFPLLFHLSLICFILVVFCVSYGDGGIWSFYTITYIAIIWWAFYYNQKVGVTFTILLACWILFWTWMEQNGFTFPNTFPEEYRYSYRAIYITMVLVVYIFIFWVANINEQRIRKKLASTQQQIIRQEKMVSLGKLTAGIAHEINNPINFIQGNTKALQKDLLELEPIIELVKELKKLDDLPQELSKAVQEINLNEVQQILSEMKRLLESTQRGSERISKIVAGLKNFSYQSKKGFRNEQVLEIVQSALAILNNRIEKNEIKIQLNLKPELIVFCEVSKMTQVFVNVLNNSIDAIEVNGQIDISATRETNKVSVIIKDNGKGMEEETMQHLFDPFFTTKEIGKGTGLGMSISYGIIQDHGGTIEVESQPGVGTQIKVILNVD